MTILYPLDSVNITGEFGNSPWYYQQFGQAGHNGVDMAANVGTPVYATDEGTVVAEGWGNYDNWMGSIAGIFVRLQHWWGFSAYAHLSSTSVDVGQWVGRGQQIALSGATGVGTGPHLHFETFPLYPNFSNGYAGRVNPAAYGLEFRNSGGSSPAPAPTPEPEPIDRRIPVAYITGYNSKSNNSKRQVVPGGEARWLHTNAKGDSALATGRGQYSLTATVDLEGTPGTRVVLAYYRVDYVNKKDVTRTFIDEIDSEILPNGRLREQLVLNNVLNKPTERLRVQIRTVKEADPVTVTRYAWRGFKWDL